MKPPVRGRCKLRIYPGVTIPDDCLVLNVIADDGRGCPFALLEGERLPSWHPGFVVMEFMSTDELEQYIARATLQALGGDDEFNAQVQAQRQFQFAFPSSGTGTSLSYPVGGYTTTGSGATSINITSTSWMPRFGTFTSTGP